jgi:hypothetical protein
VAVTVIDRLEVVQIDQRDGKRRAFAPRQRKQRGQDRVEVPAVVQAGQEVAQRLLLNPDISPDRGMMARQDASRFAHPAPSQ